MDIQRPKQPWYLRYKYYLLGGVLVAALAIYAWILSAGPHRVRVLSDKVGLTEVKRDKFLEYVDVEGVVQPILTIKVNTREAGSVQQIVAEEGTLLQQGDTLLLLDNPELLRAVDEQSDEWEKQLLGYREKEIEMEQKSLNLTQQLLQTTYELARLEKGIALDREEARMGIKSKAQLAVAEDEYRFKVENARLQRESLSKDSSMTLVRRQLLLNDRDREQKKLHRVRERTTDLVVRAPYSGQLSFVKVTPGQQVGAGESIAEIKVLDRFKIRTSLSEYYIDRITTGLPAAVYYQGQCYPMRIAKVVPEVKERMFDVDLLFTDQLPDNVRVGKSFRVQIELGQPEETLVIQRGTFYPVTGGQWIYRLDASRKIATRVPLTIGRQNPEQYEITDGLQPGDWVITTGYDTFGDALELQLD